MASNRLSHTFTKDEKEVMDRHYQIRSQIRKEMKGMTFSQQVDYMNQSGSEAVEKLGLQNKCLEKANPKKT
ncbi:hypothetical protein FACS189447_08720 [Spirochaetia bacterium]|nr:hypothetical protein FACS189447_08720 [Spirochaetia bacterium]